MKQQIEALFVLKQFICLVISKSILLQYCDTTFFPEEFYWTEDEELRLWTIMSAFY